MHETLLSEQLPFRVMTPRLFGETGLLRFENRLHQLQIFSLEHMILFVLASFFLERIRPGFLFVALGRMCSKVMLHSICYASAFWSEEASAKSQ
jgi:hypothetical protein